MNFFSLRPILIKALLSSAFFFTAGVHAAGVKVAAVTVEYDSTGAQILQITGTGLKDTGETQVFLGTTRLKVRFSSDTLTLAECAAGLCGGNAQKLTVSTFTMGHKPVLVSSVATDLEQASLSSFIQEAPVAAKRAVLVQGAYGNLVCARNVTPAPGACPDGYALIGIAEVSFGDATGCQSDAGGDVPSVKVKALCLRVTSKP